MGIIFVGHGKKKKNCFSWCEIRYRFVGGGERATHLRGPAESDLGEGHASIQGMIIEDSRFIREAVSERVRQAFHLAGAQSSDTPGHILQQNPAADGALWGRVLGSFGHRDGNLNVARIGRALAGIFVGGDMQIAECYLARTVCTVCLRKPAYKRFSGAWRDIKSAQR